MPLKNMRSLISKRVVSLILLTMICLAAVVSAQTNTDGSNPIVRSLAVDGNIRVSAKEVLSKVSLKVGDPLDRISLREDMSTIYKMGYFNEVAVDVSDVKDGVAVVFLVRENPALKELSFSGNRVFKSKRLLADLNFKSGELIYRDDLINIYTDKIKEIYKAKDYMVDVQAKKIDLPSGQVKLAFTIEEVRRGKVRQLEFIGNKALSDKKLKKIVESKSSWLMVSHFYDEMTYKMDSAKIVRAYQDLGYVLIQVRQEEPKLVPGKRGVALIYDIQEGPRFKVGQINLEGNTYFSNEYLLSKTKLKTGQTYCQSQVEKDNLSLYDQYANQGYVTSDVVRIPTIDTTNKVVNIDYGIRESQRYYVGDVKHKGILPDKDFLTRTEKGYTEVPMKTKNKVIEREIMLDTGDVFRKSEIVESQRRLNNLGFFENVVPFNQPTLSDDTMDLMLYLVEQKQTGTIHYGVGYSTQKKALVFLDVEERNLFGTGRSVRAKGDLAIEGSEYYLSYSDPYFMDTRLKFIASLMYDKLDREIDGTPYTLGPGNVIIPGTEEKTHDYSENQFGGSVGLSYPLDRYRQISLALAARHIKFETDEDGYVVPEPLGPDDVWSTSITPTYIYDTRDNVNYPTKGNRLVMSSEIATELLGGDINYVKLMADYSYFKTLTKDYIAAVRVRGGYLKPFGGTDEAPISERFFLGGPNTLRGFDFRGISPREDYVDTVNGEIVDLVKGGDVMFNLNLEIRKKLMERVVGLVFLDAGAVWSSFDEIDLGEIRYSVGPGVMVTVPYIGNVQIGYGYTLNKQEGDNDQGFYFTFGNVF